MLPFLMNFYPDELYYSWLARYHLRSGNARTVDTSIQLFGTPLKRGTRADRLFWVDELCRRTGFDPDDIIQNHSIFPYFRMGWSEDEMRKNIKAAREGDRVFRAQYKSQEKTTLRYCPLCAEEDIKNYGIAYWHVSHQYEGVEVCSQHHIRLVRQMKYISQFADNYILPKYSLIDPIIEETDPMEIALTEMVVQGIENENYTSYDIIPLVREKAKELSGRRNYKKLMEELCNDEKIVRMYERRKIKLDRPPYVRLHDCLNDPGVCTHPFYFYILRLVAELTTEEAVRISKKLKNTN